MISKVDRAALIEAAAEAHWQHLANEVASPPDLDARALVRSDAAVILSAALPLVADAIEAEQQKWRESGAYGFAIRTVGLASAARLVRSLAEEGQQ